MRWIALALVGLVLAAAVTVAARQLSSQPIGLQSEPISAGRQLAPAPRAAKPHRGAIPRTTTVAPTRTVTAPPARTGDEGGEGGDD